MEQDWNSNRQAVMRTLSTQRLLACLHVQGILWGKRCVSGLRGGGAQGARITCGGCGLERRLRGYQFGDPANGHTNHVPFHPESSPFTPSRHRPLKLIYCGRNFETAILLTGWMGLGLGPGQAKVVEISCCPRKKHCGGKLRTGCLPT